MVYEQTKITLLRCNANHGFVNHHFDDTISEHLCELMVKQKCIRLTTTILVGLSTTSSAVNDLHTGSPVLRLVSQVLVALCSQPDCHQVKMGSMVSRLQCCTGLTVVQIDKLSLITAE